MMLLTIIIIIIIIIHHVVMDGWMDGWIVIIMNQCFLYNRICSFLYQKFGIFSFFFCKED